MKKTPLKGSAKKSPCKKSPAKKGKPKDPLAAYAAFAGQKNADMEVLRLSDDGFWANVPGYVSTQCLALNKAIGAPGIPQARITEISGDEHTGKSTLLDHIFAEVQRIGGVAILMDPEVGRSATYTNSIGVDAERLLVPQPKQHGFYTVDGVFAFADQTCEWWRTQYPEVPVVIGVDTIAGLPTEEDMKRGLADGKPADAARLMRRGLRILTQRIAKTRIALVFVNQLYDVIGGSFPMQREYGGRGMRIHSTLRIRLKRGRLGNDTPILKNPEGHVIGGMTVAHIQKAKLQGVTGARTEFAVLHNRGIDNVWSLFDTFKRTGYISSGGGWYKMTLPNGDEVKWQGGHLGLHKIIADDPSIYKPMVDAYSVLP